MLYFWPKFSFKKMMLAYFWNVCLPFLRFVKNEFRVNAWAGIRIAFCFDLIFRLYAALSAYINWTNLFFFALLFSLHKVLKQERIVSKNVELNKSKLLQHGQRSTQSRMVLFIKNTLRSGCHGLQAKLR